MFTTNRTNLVLRANELKAMVKQKEMENGSPAEEPNTCPTGNTANISRRDEIDEVEQETQRIQRQLFDLRKQREEQRQREVDQEDA